MQTLNFNCAHQGLNLIVNLIVAIGEYKLVATNSSGKAEKEITLTVLSESCNGEENGVSGETNSPVSVDEFGQFVADKHANGNKKFKDRYQV